MKNLLFASPILLSLTCPSFAADTHYIGIDGVIPARVIINNNHPDEMSIESHHFKFIVLQKVILSAQAKADLLQRFKTASTISFGSLSTIPPNMYLTMNGVPVLDQGAHGTCVTFATTAALDAAFYNSDYISQLCNLELGSYLELQDNNYPSGWDGSLGSVVLSQIKKYGITSQNSQEKYGCAGVTEYPLNDPDSYGNPLSPTAFAAHSEKINSISWHELFNRNSEPNLSNQPILNLTKQAIANGHRVIFASLLDSHLGNVGALGTYKVTEDSWIITQEILNDIQKYWTMGGHEMVIIGYDDNIVMTAENGTQEKGAFILRNSWGDETGDNGNFYMSYNYFNKLAVNADEIVN